MSELIGKEFKVHNHGLVRVVDLMGGDDAIVQGARVSYGKGTKTSNEDRGLIRYLMKHAHTSPFELCVVKLHLKMPIFVARQWVRHRTCSMNEYSARYSEVKDEFYLPEKDYIQVQSKTNKQGREEEGMGDYTQNWFKETTKLENERAYTFYQEALESDMAREMARINLPLTTYTEMYWQMNLHNLLHFCKLRSDPHAQREIRDYSDIILHEIIKEWVPHTYEAFMDYVMNAATFSAHELELLKEMLLGVGLYRPEEISKREFADFCKKIDVDNPEGV